MNWRPGYHPTIVRRELEIIKRRITGQDLGRVVVATEHALQEVLEVWLSPISWNKRPGQMLASLVKAAAAAETLRAHYPGQLVFVAESELTLFMQGIVPGRTIIGRLRKALSGEFIKAGQQDAPAIGGALAMGNLDNRSRVLHTLPLVGPFIRPHLKKIDERDEGT